MKAVCVRLAMFLFLLVTSIYAQSAVDSITINELTDGSGLVRICYTAYNSDSTISTNIQVKAPESDDWHFPILTLLDTISEYSATSNLGWQVETSPTGIRHCFIWNMSNDIEFVEQCGFIARIAVFDSILTEFTVLDSFSVGDTLVPDIRAFGLTYRYGYLWVMFHDDVSHQCWIRPYSLPDMIPGDSIFIGTVTVGPSDMTFAGDRLFWTEDTRTLLKEFDFETGESHIVRGDWWDLPGTSVHIEGAAFDGEHLWICFGAGTFVALDTTDFSLVDTMFFPDFGISTPATSADGLAWGLGLLWCYSNDNIVYAIDVKSKEIIHRIPTGSVVDERGAEGAAWDGTNIWIVDYGRGNVYKIALFGNIDFYPSDTFCLDNISPRTEWRFPECPDYTDTLTAGDSVDIIWSALDSNIAGGRTAIYCGDDTIAYLASIDTTVHWEVYPWVGWHGRMQLFITDSFGNSDTTSSCVFYIGARESILDSFSFYPNKLSMSTFPNPFNSSCRIIVPEEASVKIADITGHIIATPKAVGHTRGNFVWCPDKGTASGIYFVRAQCGGENIYQQIIYVK